jgi:MtN3 and saliva related transmembrane protein
MSWILSLGQSMHYVQAWKIFTTKSAEDISLTAYIICFILVTHWLIYGFYQR